VTSFRRLDNTLWGINVWVLTDIPAMPPGISAPLRLSTARRPSHLDGGLPLDLLMLLGEALFARAD
jgi:hypothetical protein